MSVQKLDQMLRNVPAMKDLTFWRWEEVVEGPGDVQLLEKWLIIDSGTSRKHWGPSEKEV